MQENTLDQKCPSCRAPLKFSPKSNGWDCDYCGSHFTIDDLEKVKKQKEQVQKKKMNAQGYNCKNCGAQILVNDNVTATSCIYCRSSAIIESRLTNEFTPTSVIPFKKTKEEAMDAFKQTGLRRFFIPKEFADRKNISEIQGIYIPFWLYDYQVDSKVTGVGNVVSSWSSGNYIYTKTDEYAFTRRGTFPFYDIPVDGSKHFDDALMNSIEPFDYKELVPFNEAYLSGFLAEKYDQTKEEVQSVAIARAENTIMSEINETLRQYSSKIINEKTFTPSSLNGEYVLLPVWLLNIKYKDKIYPYAMNGQTGKMIGDIPVQKSKVIFFFLIFSILLTIIVSLLFILIGGYSL